MLDAHWPFAAARSRALSPRHATRAQLTLSFMCIALPPHHAQDNADIYDPRIVHMLKESEVGGGLHVLLLLWQQLRDCMLLSSTVSLRPSVPFVFFSSNVTKLCRRVWW